MGPPDPISTSHVQGTSLDLMPSELNLDLPSFHAPSSSCSSKSREAHVTASENQSHHLKAGQSADSPFTHGHYFSHPAHARSKISPEDNPSAFLLERAAKAAERQLAECHQLNLASEDKHVSIQHYIDHLETPGPASRGSLCELEMGSSCSDPLDLELVSRLALHQRRNVKPGDAFEGGMRSKASKRKKSVHTPIDIAALGHDHEFTSEEWSALVQLDEGQLNSVADDVEILFCEEPQSVRFDITQGTEYLRRTVCYLTDQTGTSPPPSAGLWSVQKSEANDSSQESLPALSRVSSNCGGLWGACTPRIDDDGHLDAGFGSPLSRHFPPSPPPSTIGCASLEERLEAEGPPWFEADTLPRTEDEVTDEFVTQVYNYMCLGYPAIARDYDEELSQISKISLYEIRRDNALPTSLGYFRLGDEKMADGITPNMCVRWKALKLYMQEWTRQECERDKILESPIEEKKPVSLWGR